MAPPFERLSCEGSSRGGSQPKKANDSDVVPLADEDQNAKIEHDRDVETCWEPARGSFHPSDNSHALLKTKGPSGRFSPAEVTASKSAARCFSTPRGKVYGVGSLHLASRHDALVDVEEDGQRPVPGPSLGDLHVDVGGVEPHRAGGVP